MCVVYLAGGMHSYWRDRLLDSHHSLINPKDRDWAETKMDTPSKYTPWDLAAIDASDVVFAYWDEENPSGYGLCLEIGYALARGKLVILCDEKQDPRGDMARAAASVCFAGEFALEDGIEYLESITW